MPEQLIGRVTHFFSQAMVAGILITDGELQVGDIIKIHGHTTDFQQAIDSMQVEHQKVLKAKPGDNIGIKVKDKVREHDVVYKVTA